MNTRMHPSEVPGHTKPKAGRELERLASLVPSEQAIVEIGVFKGRSVCYLGLGAEEGRGARVWGIDPWDLPGERYPFNWKQERPSRHAFTDPATYTAAQDNVFACGLAERVTLIKSMSVAAGDAWDERQSIGLLHVDGDHRFDAVLADWQAWSPHLASGATVCFDDHVPTCQDVMDVVAKLVRENEIEPIRMATRRLAVTRFLG